MDLDTHIVMLCLFLDLLNFVYSDVCSYQMDFSYSSPKVL